MLVPEDVKKCVTFVCYKDKSGKEKLAGTALLLLVHSEIDKSYGWGYIVTAKHVIAGIKMETGDNKVYLRLNVRNGKAQLFPIDLKEWIYHDDPSVDVAISPQTLNHKIIDCAYWSIDNNATPEWIKEQEVGIGDEIFVTGLFVNHVGRNNNLPILRTGNIAMMADKNELVRGKLGMPTDMEAYLIECRSIGGLSGSPVFVHLSPFRRKDKTAKPLTDTFRLLGIIHGHWDTEQHNEDKLKEDIASFSREAINQGIAIVTPVTKIIDLLTSDEVKAIRN